MTYRENVDRAAMALARGEDANWELARLTFENTREPGPGDQPGRVTMAEWCADVCMVSGRGFSSSSAALYKAAWRRFGLQVPGDQRISWTEAYRQVAKAVTPRAVDEPEMQYKSLLSPTLAPEAKRAVFETLASDPDVIEQASEVGTPISRAVSGLEHRAAKIREQRREQMIQADPIARGFDEGRAQADLMSICDRYARESERVAVQIADLLRRSGDISEDRRFWIQQAVERLSAVLALLKGYAEKGQTDLDAFLDSVLAGGDRG